MYKFNIQTFVKQNVTQFTLKLQKYIFMILLTVNKITCQKIENYLYINCTVFPLTVLPNSKVRMQNHWLLYLCPCMMRSICIHLFRLCCKYRVWRLLPEKVSSRIQKSHFEIDEMIHVCSVKQSAAKQFGVPRPTSDVHSV